VFIYGTDAEIRPIVKIDGRPIGEGDLGPTTGRAIQVYEDYIEEHGVPIEYESDYLRKYLSPRRSVRTTKAFSVD
jgi:hypothetical protein